LIETIAPTTPSATRPAPPAGQAGSDRTPPGNHHGAGTPGIPGTPELSGTELRHELGNAITPALGYAEFLLRRLPSNGDERERRALLAIVTGLRRATGLVAPERRVSPPCDLRTLVRAMACQVPPERSADVVVRWHTDRALAGPWDSDHLAQVLANLLNNAAKYSAAGTPIELVVTADGDHAEISVRDQGIGIAPHNLHAVFEGYRTPAARRYAPGSGVGLDLSRRLVEAEGGSLSATSEPGRGSTFTLRLPICEAASHVRAA